MPTKALEEGCGEYLLLQVLPFTCRIVEWPGGIPETTAGVVAIYQLVWKFFNILTSGDSISVPSSCCSIMCEVLPSFLSSESLRLVSNDQGKVGTPPAFLHTSVVCSGPFQPCLLFLCHHICFSVCFFSDECLHLHGCLMQWESSSITWASKHCHSKADNQSTADVAQWSKCCGLALTISLHISQQPKKPRLLINLPSKAWSQLIMSLMFCEAIDMTPVGELG